MNLVTLNPAFVWDCNNCGKENFERGIVIEEDNYELKGDYGIEDDDEGEFLLMPTEVICYHCGEFFETEHYQNTRTR